MVWGVCEGNFAFRVSLKTNLDAFWMFFSLLENAWLTFIGHFGLFLGGWRVSLTCQKHGFRAVHLSKINFSTSLLPRHLLEAPSKRFGSGWKCLRTFSRRPLGVLWRLWWGPRSAKFVFSRLGRCSNDFLLSDTFQGRFLVVFRLTFGCFEMLFYVVRSSILRVLWESKCGRCAVHFWHSLKACCFSVKRPDDVIGISNV